MRKLIFNLLVFYSSLSFAQTDSLIVKKKSNRLLIAEGIVYSTSFIGLYNLWYKDYEMVSFHFFNDSQEWLQLDKAGHMHSTYWTSKLNSELFLWAGKSTRKSVLYGTGISLLYISTIEIFDGFSENWGASLSDISVNILGAGLYAGQQLLWNEQKVLLKYSYYPSNYAADRPEMLGSNLPEKMLKDYNATTFWLSFNLQSITTIKIIPAWLQLAIGYGGDGLTGGSENYFDQTCNCYPVENSKRIRQYYLSLDVDLSRIKVKNRFIKSVFSIVNTLKFPFPVIEFTKNNTNFHLYR